MTFSFSQSAPGNGWAAARLGWKPSLLLFLAGAVCALALPPLHVVPVLFAGFGILVWRLGKTDSIGRALGTGWLFGWGHFSAGLYWLGLPVIIDVPSDLTKDLLLAGGLVGVPVAALLLGGLGIRLTTWRWLGTGLGILVALLIWVAVAVILLPGRFTWMIPFNVFGLGALLATTTAVAVAIAYRAAPHGIARVLILAAAWAVLEWVRSTILSGFPWNLMATVWAEFPGASQSVAWWSPFGLSLVTVLLAALPGILIHPRQVTRRMTAWAAGLVIAASIPLLAGLLLVPDRVSAVPRAKLRIVQGAVTQTLKWQRGAREKILLRYGELTLSKGIGTITHVIWPETAIPYRIQTQYASAVLRGNALQYLLATIPKDGVLITGANRDVGRDTWNSVHVVAKDGSLVSTYDKHHLVPFGEYVPARRFLSQIGVAKIAHGRGDYSFGPGPRTITVPGAPPASPLICYEAIFPAKAVGRKRPGWLLNVTNDAWFGNSAGPYQHFASARLRAIEQGLPMVRAANTGISAVVGPYGRVQKLLPLGVRGILDSSLPSARSATLYARYGDLTLAVLILLTFLLPGSPICTERQTWLRRRFEQVAKATTVN